MSNLATLLDSNSLQPAFDFTTIFYTGSFHYKLQKTFQKKTRNETKECNLLKIMFCLYEVSTSSLSSLNFLPRSEVFTIIDNPGIFRLLSQCISISLMVKQDILYSNLSFFWMLISIFSSILFTRTASISLVFILIFFH